MSEWGRIEAKAREEQSDGGLSDGAVADWERYPMIAADCKGVRIDWQQWLYTNQNQA